MNNKNEELFLILKSDDHPQKELYKSSLIAVFHFVTKDFSKAEYIFAINSIEAFAKALDDENDTDKEILANLKMAIYHNQLWQLIESYFYTNVFNSGFLRDILPYSFHISVKEFQTRLHNQFIILENNLGSKDEIDRLYEQRMLQNRYKLLQDPKIILRLQKTYIQNNLNSDFRNKLGVYLQNLSSDEIHQCTRLVLKELADSEQSISTSDVEIHIKQLHYFYNHPKVKMKYIDILKREEELGFITYQELVANGKELLFKRLKKITNVSPFFIKGKYNLNLQKDRQRFKDELLAIGPYNIHLLYNDIHFTCMTELLVFFHKMIVFSVIPIREDLEKIYQDQLNLLIRNNLPQIIAQIEKQYTQLSEKFNDLFEHGGKVSKQLESGREQDFSRGLISSLSPILLAKNIYRIYREEVDGSQHLDKVNSTAEVLYSKHLNSLAQVETTLMAYYEKLYHEIYMNLFLPFMKKAFKSYEPVRKFGGIEEYQLLMFSSVSNIRTFYQSLEIKRMPHFSSYIKDEYFGVKTLKY